MEGVFFFFFFQRVMGLRFTIILKVLLIGCDYQLNCGAGMKNGVQEYSVLFDAWRQGVPYKWWTCSRALWYLSGCCVGFVFFLGFIVLMCLARCRLGLVYMKGDGSPAGLFHCCLTNWDTEQREMHWNHKAGWRGDWVFKRFSLTHNAFTAS